MSLLIAGVLNLWTAMKMWHWIWMNDPFGLETSQERRKPHNISSPVKWSGSLHRWGHSWCEWDWRRCPLLRRPINNPACYHLLWNENADLRRLQLKREQYLVPTTTNMWYSLRPILHASYDRHPYSILKRTHTHYDQYFAFTSIRDLSFTFRLKATVTWNPIHMSSPSQFLASIGSYSPNLVHVSTIVWPGIRISNSAPSIQHHNVTTIPTRFKSSLHIYLDSKDLDVHDPALLRQFNISTRAGSIMSVRILFTIQE